MVKEIGTNDEVDNRLLDYLFKNKGEAQLKENILNNKTVTRLDELKLVGYRVLCPGDQYSVEIPKAVRQLEQEKGKIKHLKNPSRQIGAFVVDSDTDEEDGYWACMEVETFEDIPEGMVTLTIPAQSYAVWEHRGPTTGIMKSYEELHQWIDENHYNRLTNRWHLEVYYQWRDSNNLKVALLDTVQDKEKGV
ncbi:GyrI-like domain-containing protein [Ornithinibacillus massiliensis]|uniref:GyrI-like domain-containing protein n=2 Tax=Ornithinibacillus massiliensis TaxID=1944633 RepID=A0ABS5MDS3_9BACI|nr:GyrI-like domain-containing protein [Ornithinibacillus massiliensis]